MKEKMEATDFYIGGDININLKLETTGEDLQELDGIDWYGMYRPECPAWGSEETCSKETHRLYYGTS